MVYGETVKVLIAILSCIPHAVNGYNQVMRDTWLKDTGSAEYRFFIGDGTNPAEDMTLLEYLDFGSTSNPGH